MATPELHTGAIVQDCDGDRWTLHGDGRWHVMPVLPGHGNGLDMATLRKAVGSLRVISEGLED